MIDIGLSEICLRKQVAVFRRLNCRITIHATCRGGTIAKHVRFLVLVGLLVVLIAISPCCAPAAKPLETEADFHGFITGIHLNREGDTIGQISVESHADKLVSKCVVTITDETLIFQKDGDELRPVDFEELENQQQWVKIWFTGPVLESYPVQATASQVVIEQ
jgi:hypothetical protein